MTHIFSQTDKLVNAMQPSGISTTLKETDMNSSDYNFLSALIAQEFPTFEVADLEAATIEVPVFGWNLEFAEGDKVEFMGRKGEVVDMTVDYDWQVPVVFNKTGGDSGYVTIVHSENLTLR